VDLANGHLYREDKKIMEAKKFLFTDTNAITTFMFSNYYHGFALPALTVLAKAAETRYQIFILCGTDIPYDDTWDRSGNVKRKEFQEQIRLDLEKRKIPFKVLNGNIAERLEMVEKELHEYRRW
jgi:nicotinamide riboside kinase